MVTLPDSEPEPDIAVVRLPVSLSDYRHPHADEIYLLLLMVVDIEKEMIVEWIN